MILSLFQISTRASEENAGAKIAIVEIQLY